MTCIAWKDGIIAVDRQCSRGNIKFEDNKLHVWCGQVITWAGAADYGQALLHWYQMGADPERFPAFQREKDFVQFVVASHGVVKIYYQTPHPCTQYGPFGALGSGGEFAAGAMAWGASAEEAVMLASKHCDGVGFGVDSRKY